MADLLQRLEQEAAALPPQEMRFDPAYRNNPWSYRPKSRERFDQDQRSAYVLSRLSEQFPGARASQELPPELVRQVRAYEQSPEAWSAPHESVAGSHPLYNGFQWAQSLPSAIYATGKMLGNEVDKAVYKSLTGDEERNDQFPEAYNQYQHSANTFTGGVLDPTGPSYWKDVEGVRLQQDRAPQVGYYPSSILDQRIADEGHKEAQQIEDGRQFLERSGANPAYASIAGPLLDATMSFPSSLGPAAQSLKAGKPLSALLDMGGDVLLSNPQIPFSMARKYSEGKLPWEN